MRAAILLEPGRIELDEVPVPEPGAGEVVVRVEAALTCGTDLKTFRRGHPHIPLPAPLGHEFSGTITAVGAGVDRFRAGDAVAAVPTAPCGTCRLCRRGRDSLCADAVGRILLGAFADYIRVPAHIVETNLFHRPSVMAPQVAAALEPLSCVVHGASRVPISDAETIVFLGDGPIALLFLQLARLQAPAARAMVVGRHTARLHVARALGAESTVHRDQLPVEDTVRDWTGGAGADLVIECVGTPDAWQEAQRLCAVAGIALLFGGCRPGTVACFDTFRTHYQEIDLRAAFHYGRRAVREAWELLKDGQIRVTPLITHERALSDLADAFELALARTAIKVAVHP